MIDVEAGVKQPRDHAFARVGHREAVSAHLHGIDTAGRTRDIHLRTLLKAERYVSYLTQTGKALHLVGSGENHGHAAELRQHFDPGVAEVAAGAVKFDYYAVGRLLSEAGGRLGADNVLAACSLQLTLVVDSDTARKIDFILCAGDQSDARHYQKSCFSHICKCI